MMSLFQFARAVHKQHISPYMTKNESEPMGGAKQSIGRYRSRCTFKTVYQIPGIDYFTFVAASNLSVAHLIKKSCCGFRAPAWNTPVNSFFRRTFPALFALFALFAFFVFLFSVSLRFPFLSSIFCVFLDYAAQR